MYIHLVSELETRLKVINYSPKMYSKTLLLTTPHTYFIEHEEMYLETSVYLLVLVELCMLPEEKNDQSHLVGNPVTYNNDLPGNECL